MGEGRCVLEEKINQKNNVILPFLPTKNKPSSSSVGFFELGDFRRKRILTYLEQFLYICYTNYELVTLGEKEFIKYLDKFNRERLRMRIVEKERLQILLFNMKLIMTENGGLL